MIRSGFRQTRVHFWSFAIGNTHSTSIEIQPQVYVTQTPSRYKLSCIQSLRQNTLRSFKNRIKIGLIQKLLIKVWPVHPFSTIDEWTLEKTDRQVHYKGASSLQTLSATKKRRQYIISIFQIDPRSKVRIFQRLHFETFSDEKDEKMVKKFLRQIPCSVQ